MTTPGPLGSLGTLRMILQAAAGVLSCGSAQMALVDEVAQSLVVRLAVGNRELGTLSQVESLIGFSPDGAFIPLAAEGSLMVRAVREGRLFVTTRFAELVADVLPPELCEQIQSVIGVHSFAVVPVLGRSRPLGIILFQKEGDGGYSHVDRDLLLAYADRVGAALESQAVTAEAEALSSPSTEGLEPSTPRVLLCDDRLHVCEGAETGQPLWTALCAAAAEAELSQVAATRAARTLSVQTDDGRPLRLTLRPVRLAAGHGFIAVSEDVRWIGRMLRETVHARDHLARVLRSVGDAILTLDADDRVVGCNAAVEPTLGLRPADALGRTFASLLADEPARRRARTLHQKLLAEGYVESELSFVHAASGPTPARAVRAGRVLPAAVSALLLADDEGHPAGALWRVRDLSERRRGDAERKRLRARLLRSERLSALGEMAARIAHEVRNPLVSIGAAARLVEEELSEAQAAGGTPTPAHLVDEARAIQREVRRLDAIVSGFLRFARGHQPARPTDPHARHEVDLGQLVAETVELARARAPHVELRVVTPAPSPCLVPCDPDGLRQVLWNLLSNAVDAALSPGAHAPALVTCEVRPERDHVLLTVTDSGPGLSPEARRRAFDPFYSTKARGTGLGLSISRQIVDQHRGRLRLLNRRQGGALARVELPR